MCVCTFFSNGTITVQLSSLSLFIPLPPPFPTTPQLSHKLSIAFTTQAKIFLMKTAIKDQHVTDQLRGGGVEEEKAFNPQFIDYLLIPSTVLGSKNPQMKRIQSFLKKSSPVYEHERSLRICYS